MGRGRLGWGEEVTRVMRFVFADGCSLTSGRVLALAGGGEM